MNYHQTRSSFPASNRPLIFGLARMFFWVSLPLSFFALLAPSLWLQAILRPGISLNQDQIVLFCFLVSFPASRWLTGRVLAWALNRFRD